LLLLQQLLLLQLPLHGDLSDLFLNGGQFSRGLKFKLLRLLPHLLSFQSTLLLGYALFADVDNTEHNFFCMLPDSDELFIRLVLCGLFSRELFLLCMD
jgi:hypothetical protein